MVSYSISEARHSGDGVILLVSLRSYDAHLSVTFISDLQRIVIKFMSYVSTVHLLFSFEFRSPVLFISFLFHACSLLVSYPKMG